MPFNTLLHGRMGWPAYPAW